MPQPTDHTDPAARHRPPHMSPEEFRQAGYRMIDTIADYMRAVESMPVRPPTAPGDILDALPDAAPESPEPWDDIHRDLDTLITPNLTHWQHPSFFAYFSCNASGPAILGELASAGLNVNGMLWSTSPAATELETRLLDWCARVLGLPDAFLSTTAQPNSEHGPIRGGGVIQGTASEATLVALLAARERARTETPKHEWEDTGVLITSDQSHSSVVKAAMIAGLADSPDDRRRVRTVDTHPDGRIDLDHLRETVHAARHEGRAVIMASVTAGTTGTGAIDDAEGVRTVLDEAHRSDGQGPWKGWLHLDAAWAGAAAVCPEHQNVLAGAAFADSVCMNPHKWLLTNFDCDLMWARDTDAIVRALSITPEYLRNAQTDAGAVIDYRDWQIPLGRRFRALKLWFVIRHYGLEGLRAHIRRHVAWAAWFEEQVLADDRFELACPRSLSLVCFRVKHSTNTTDPTRALLERINASGEVFLSHTAAPGDGRFTIRFVPGATATEFRHVVRAWELISDAAGGITPGVYA